MINEKWKINGSCKDAFNEMLSEYLATPGVKTDNTQEEIANIVGIYRQKYYPIETGHRTILRNACFSLLLFFYTYHFTRSMLRDFYIYPKELMIKMCGI